ncbi:SHOCT domain-containing protein [Nocardioides antri]|uniref:SHOCT domain-containing protein n=1 Tax=Nocardioides antri TaxID=2607659 RepID=A0A5B1M682_9ACTN|nr:SHOCT domain-containing protein [Nocardioides antri]KAA1427988.1 SHOCT domain-containing protein [Nocardioides antri]
MSDTLTTLVLTADRWDGDGPPWLVFPLFWLLFIAAVVVAVVYHRRRNRLAPRQAGEARLAELFATGEISEEEYRARRGVLREK